MSDTIEVVCVQVYEQVFCPYQPTTNFINYWIYTLRHVSSRESKEGSEGKESMRWSTNVEALSYYCRRQWWDNRKEIIKPLIDTSFIILWCVLLDPIPNHLPFILFYSFIQLLVYFVMLWRCCVKKIETTTRSLSSSIYSAAASAVVLCICFGNIIYSLITRSFLPSLSQSLNYERMNEQMNSFSFLP